MIITYHEGECMKVSAGDTTLVFGPVSKESKNFKPTNFGADVAFISLNHADMNGAEEAARGDKKPFVISGAGEYEVKEIAAFGFSSKSKYADAEHINTIYSIAFDGLSLMYLGALCETTLPKEVLEMDPPDVLIVPIGGVGTLNPSDAQKVAVQLEPKIVIPMHYDEKTLKQFLKEAGDAEVEKVEKLTLKPRDVVGKEGDIVVITA